MKKGETEENSGSNDAIQATPEKNVKEFIFEAITAES
jgi:hypothetical protein